jgi:hypothetical protein
MRIHIRSRCHDPAHSAALRRFLVHVEVGLSVHGFGRDSFRVAVDPIRGVLVEPYGPRLLHGQTGPLRGVIIGGRNAELLEQARRSLSARLAGYRVGSDRVRLGFHPANPVNLPRLAGVQIELPPALRGIGDFGDRPAPDADDPALATVIDALVEVVEHADAGLAATRAR